MFLRAIIQLTIGFDKAKEILSNVTIHTHTTPPPTHTHHACEGCASCNKTHGTQAAPELACLSPRHQQCHQG